MTVIIKDGAFQNDTWQAEGGSFTSLEELKSLGGKPENSNAPLGIDLEPSDSPEEVWPMISGIDAVRISFPSFADGRGFSIAKFLREAGFKGVIRAHGHVLCDQYPLAVRCGIDEVEIDAEMALRQPEEFWHEAFKRVKKNYSSHLGANALENSAARL